MEDADQRGHVLANGPTHKELHNGVRRVLEVARGLDNGPIQVGLSGRPTGTTLTGVGALVPVAKYCSP
jgi:hypothetical protein